MPVRRALIIEGEQTIRISLFPYLQEAGLDIYGATSLEDARALLPVLKPTLTIVDRELRDGDGLDLIEAAVETGAHAVVVSSRNDVADRKRALSLGADDYLGKPADPEEIYLRVRRLLAISAEEYIERDTVHDFGGVRIELTSRAVLRPDGSAADELTETELGVLRILVENTDRVVSREALYPIVTGAEFSGKPTRAIDTCVSRLRIKLKSASVGAEIRSVRQAGYLYRREGGFRSAVR
jgi:two-component system, OmpR family, response regulator